jgi:Fe-S oxidoreductase
MRALPVLEPRRPALEKCVFCPKLCRSACPVSNAEPRETLTPWGKMSLAWMAAHGDVPLDVSHASPAWACTGCFACRELCDHRNPVADVLLDARAAALSRRAAPEGALRVIGRFAQHDVETRLASRRLAANAPAGTVHASSRTALLVGCGYVRAAPAEALHAVEAAAALTRGPVALVDACCGLPLRLAGDLDAFRRHALGVARSLQAGGHARLVVVDAGCALAMRRRYPEADVALPRTLRTELLVEIAAEALATDSKGGSAGVLSARRPSLKPLPFGALDVPVRWHDPCQLGRGLGVFDAPRTVLARALGRPPDEFPAAREHAVCSGAGGLLPSTMPETSRGIARTRLQEAAREGGGRVVTACASSLIAFRKGAAEAGVAVDDLVSWIAQAACSPRG